MADFPATARAALNAALDQLGAGPEITRGIVVAQLHAAETRYLEGVGQEDFAKARRTWSEEKETILAARFLKWFGMKKEPSLF